MRTVGRPATVIVTSPASTRRTSSDSR
jgi:hypothetical protein